MAHPRSTIEQELAQCPPLSAGFTQEFGKSRFHANLMFFDHLMPHLSLIATLAVAAYSILMKNWMLTGCAGFSFLLLFIVRMLIANKAIRHFDDGIAMFKLPFFEYGIIWRNLATKLRYWRADKNDFTSHKL